MNHPEDERICDSCEEPFPVAELIAVPRTHYAGLDFYCRLCAQALVEWARTRRAEILREHALL